MVETHSENTRRIAKNTLLLTVRMLFGMLVSLYTSRVVLQALGVDDYGIYGVVGGLVAMFSIVSGSLQASISRFITYELGINNIERLKKTFSTAFMVQVLLAIIVFMLGETLGVWFLNTKMVIPADRLFAANIVFQASIFSFMLSLILMPYNACINAHEHMDVYAYLGILDALLRLGIVLFIAYGGLKIDKLIVYSISLVLLGIFMQLINVRYCLTHFCETKVRWKIDRGYIKQMGKFAGWNFIGASSALMRDNGGNILLNLFFGPAVNAARSVSMSVTGAVTGFSSNLMGAINPQITKSYAAGDNNYMISLIFKSARFSYYIIFLIGLPVLFDTTYILNLWLVDVPNYAAIFIKWSIVFALIESVSNPLITAQLATGNIRNYQIVVGGLQMLNLPISYIALKFGAPPYAIFVVACCIGILCLSGRLCILRVLIGFPSYIFVKKVVLNILAITGLSVAIPFIANDYLSNDLLGFILSTLICDLSAGFFIFTLGMTTDEREYIKTKIFRKIKLTVQKCSR